ncbi:S8 family serine peptidase [Streptomyces sp. B1866]|uniref:S8 family serine peptidase n=1 Tax=Streptomyces sp. B1866 TaxID=3075431 RepID=UPI00288F1B96|nr:S8 family serine peptidase [Streptomyces sp. B1866]MDT3398187.1 S8 family serine peptidase [Streptomyces sp. B1866]
MGGMQTRFNNARKRAVTIISLLASLLAFGSVVAPAATADTIRERQWYLDRMHAEDMWKVSTGKGITVAVLDGGVDASVPELRGKVLRGKNLAGSGRDARTDPKGHGTAMAMLIAGSGLHGQGIQGLAPDVRILPLTVSGNTQELVGTSAPILASAIRYAADSNAQIINMSIGFVKHATDEQGRRQIQQAVDYAVEHGKLLFASAGNDGESGIYYPAAAEGIAAVAAIDRNVNHARFSSYGPEMALAAPGDDMPIRCLDGETGYCRSGGTSQAAAIASASAALIWSKHPTWTGNQVLRVLIETAGKPTTGKVPSRYIGYGSIRPRLNILENKGDPGPADVNPLVAARQAQTQPSGSPSTAGSPSPGTAPKGEAPSDTEASGSSDSGSSALPWVIGGVGAAVVIGAVLFVVLRRRRAGTPPTAPPLSFGAPPYASGPYGAPPSQLPGGQPHVQPHQQSQGPWPPSHGAAPPPPGDR